MVIPARERTSIHVVSFFVEETTNPAVVRASQTITVNPRRGSQDKNPWRSLDLTGITGQTIEIQHVFDVHLGETLVPYAMLEPLKAVLPLRIADDEIPADSTGVGGIQLGGLERRMRDRWRITSALWEENKQRHKQTRLAGEFGPLRQAFISAQMATEF